MSKASTKKKTTAKKKSPAKRVAPKVAVVEEVQPPLKRRRIHLHRSHLSFLLIMGVLLIIGTLGYNYIDAANQRQAERQLDAVGLTDQASETHYFYAKQLKPLVDDLHSFETSQTSAGLEIVSQTTIDTQIHQIESALSQDKFHLASQSTLDLRTKLNGWKKSLADQTNAAKLKRSSIAGFFGLVPPVGHQLQVPILIYHKTPSDFEQQLEVLKNRNYTTITLAQLVAAWNGASLPAKPVIITFDDGFADQMQAFALLEKYQMKATFYIIDGGAGSNWCIGANRRYNDPSQPTTGCGDAYLTWDQIRQLDDSGLITIGSHTINHPDLANETPDQQQAEIVGGKTELESEIGHKVSDFAYPYGDYNQATIAIVKAAGFATAVTTAPGTLQSGDDRYTLERIRSTYNLP